MWDVAGAARLWAPLRPDGDIADARRGRSLRAAARLRRRLRPARATSASWWREAVQPNHTWCYDNVRRHAEAGHRGFSTFWRGGGADLSARVQEWFDLNAAAPSGRRCCSRRLAVAVGQSR